MRELSIEKMEMVSGGGFLDGFCTVMLVQRAGMVGLAAFGRAAAMITPGVGQAMAVATIGCLAYTFMK
ncbi:hypothetical protein MM236_16210 [Belliella sp. DSM 107340]|uniref:Uncharacterized protein n=1 Tax=Belliella calami TaxID=2923436 RepID=A0ABS9UTG3_9BACT|nr:hypothetical protein [Belliella calami]MCH7399548.1 hypothetical protein [Belliella calami]